MFVRNSTKKGYAFTCSQVICSNNQSQLCRRFQQKCKLSLNRLCICHKHFTRDTYLKVDEPDSRYAKSSAEAGLSGEKPINLFSSDVTVPIIANYCVNSGHCRCHLFDCADQTIIARNFANDFTHYKMAA